MSRSREVPLVIHVFESLPLAHVPGCHPTPSPHRILLMTHCSLQVAVGFCEALCRDGPDDWAKPDTIFLTVIKAWQHDCAVFVSGVNFWLQTSPPCVPFDAPKGNQQFTKWQVRRAHSGRLCNVINLLSGMSPEGYMCLHAPISMAPSTSQLHFSSMICRWRVAPSDEDPNLA